MAKVLKLTKTMKGKVHTFWQVDARSMNKGQISKNPNTNKRFESKKEAQDYLDELIAKQHSGLSLNADDLEVHKLCLPGEYVEQPGSNSGQKIFDQKAGEYISARYRHLERDAISFNHFQSMRRSMYLVVTYCNKYKIKYWTKLDAERCLDWILKECKKNANPKETPELREASAWTTFLVHQKNIKCMSSWVARNKKCEDVFACIVTSKKHGGDLTFEKPAKLVNLQKKQKDKVVNVLRVEELRYRIEKEYMNGYKGNRGYSVLKNKPEFAKNRKRQMLLQFDLLKGIGLRIGEALALTWDDIDGDEIRINKQYNAKEKAVTETKGGVFEHYVYVGDDLAKRLQEHKELQNDQEKINNLVFPNTKGNHDSRNSLNLIMKRYSKKLWGNDISLHISPHTLRHLFATEMIRKGGKDALPMVSDILRHSTGVKFTEKQYVHETKKSEKQRIRQKEAVSGLYA